VDQSRNTYIQSMYGRKQIIVDDLKNCTGPHTEDGTAKAWVKSRINYNISDSESEKDKYIL